MLTVTLVGHLLERSVLDGLRAVLDDAEEAVLCPALVRRAGVHLVEAALATLGARGRLVTGPVSREGSSVAALAAVHDTAVALRVADPPARRFRPGIYVARHRTGLRALVGAPVLTAGLMTDLATAVLLAGDGDDPVLRAAWDTAQAAWAMQAAEAWTPAAEVAEELLPEELYAALVREVARDPVFLSVRHKRPHRVTEITRSGVWIETDALLLRRLPSQFVPAWMLTLAWEVLLAEGTLTATLLRADDGLNLTRASEICAFLARLPDVQVASTRPVTLSTTLRARRAPARASRRGS